MLTINFPRLIKGRPRSIRGLTLVEVLTVVGILGILLVMVVPALAKSRRSARIAGCKSNMKEMYNGIQMWDDDVDRMKENYPGRITFLYYYQGNRLRENMMDYNSASTNDINNVYVHAQRYSVSEKIFICPLDNSRGREGGKPAGAENQFAETDEGPGLGKPQLMTKSPWSSYLYEFSEARCGWWFNHVESAESGTPFGPYYDSDTKTWLTESDEGDAEDEIIDTNWDLYVSWQEAKFYQQKYGDIFLHDNEWYGGYPRSWFPIIRCFWHQSDADKQFQKDILNVSMSGNTFESGPKWEEVATENLVPDADLGDSLDDFWDEDLDEDP